MPKSNAIFSALKKTVTKVYRIKLDKIVKQVLEIRKVVEKIEARKSLLEQKMARLKEGAKERDKVMAEMDALLEKEKALKEKENAILDLANEGDKVSKS